MAQVLTPSEVDALLNAVNGLSLEENALVIAKELQARSSTIKEKIEWFRVEHPNECEALVERYNRVSGEKIEEYLILRIVLDPKLFPLESLDPKNSASFPWVDDDLSALRAFF